MYLFLILFLDNNMENIEQNFSDWSDDSDDDILNRPGETVRQPIDLYTYIVLQSNLIYLTPFC